MDFFILKKNKQKYLQTLIIFLLKKKLNSKLEFLEDFYFYVVKAQYKTTRNGKRYILLNVINESGFFDLRLFDDKFDVSSLHAKYIKAKIKSSLKMTFIMLILIIYSLLKDDDLINQINHISYQELLDLDKVK